MQANVVLCKCPQTKSVFGIRIEKRENDWVRTWAFKINESQAKREGFDKTKMVGTMQPTPEYPGCPDCGAKSFAPCSCGKNFCAPDWTGKPLEMTCPWCGRIAIYHPTEKIEVDGGGI